MDIGIIGSGQIGGTLTRRLTALGHNVSIANSRGPASLAELSAETGARAVTVEEAARARDIVIVAIPQAAVPQLPPDLFSGTSALSCAVYRGAPSSPGNGEGARARSCGACPFSGVGPCAPRAWGVWSSGAAGTSPT